MVFVCSENLFVTKVEFADFASRGVPSVVHVIPDATGRRVGFLSHLMIPRYMIHLCPAMLYSSLYMCGFHNINFPARTQAQEVDHHPEVSCSRMRC